MSSPVFHPLWGILPSRAWLRETSSAFQAPPDTRITSPLTPREMLCSHEDPDAQRGTQHVHASLKLNSTPQLGPYTQTTASCKVFVRHNSLYNKRSLQNMLNEPCPKSSHFPALTRAGPWVNSSGAHILCLSVLKSTPGRWSRKCVYSCSSALSGVGSLLLSKAQSYVPDNSKDKTKLRKEFREAEKCSWAFDEQTSLTDWLPAIQIDQKILLLQL